MTEHFKLDQPKKDLVKKMRLFLVKQGILTPKNLSETREAFPFPLQRIEQPKTRLWGMSIEKRYSDGGVRGTI